MSPGILQRQQLCLPVRNLVLNDMGIQALTLQSRKRRLLFCDLPRNLAIAGRSPLPAMSGADGTVATASEATGGESWAAGIERPTSRNR